MSSGVKLDCGMYSYLADGSSEATTPIDSGSYQLVLPKTDNPLDPQNSERHQDVMYTGSETILLAEDNVLVREMTAMALRKKGYTVLEAADGQEALQIAELNADRLSLVMTDVIMPRMNGLELALRLRANYPDIGIVMFSGYCEEISAGRSLNLPQVRTLHKPFSLSDMLCTVRDLIDSSRQSDAHVASVITVCEPLEHGVPAAA